MRHYLYRDFAKKLNINSSNYAKYNKYISYCLSHTFSECYLNYSDTCDNCKSLLQEKLSAYQNWLIIFMAYYACKSYLNTQFNA